MQGQQQPVKTQALPLLKKKTFVSLSAQDFTIKNRLGRGAYGDVFLCQKHSDLKHYAMKQIQKKKLEKQKKQYQALIQKEILSVLKHPAIVKLKYAFQDKKILYFIMDLCQGGEFLQFIKLNIDQLTQQIKKFYVAEIVNILQYLHKNGITHRDIKPQNLMLSQKGHLKIIDFGTAEISNCSLISQNFKDKIQAMKKKTYQQQFQQQQQLQQVQSPRKKQRRSTFVGTCHYISPQLIEQNYCPPEADLWALGCIIYQLYYKQTPFKDNYEFAVFQKIKKCQLQFPNNKDITPNAIDLISKLLKKNPDERLGSGKNPQLTYQQLKNHPYFDGINVDMIFQQKVPKIEQMKQPEPVGETTQENQDKKQKTRTQFTIQMLAQMNKLQKQQVKKILIHGLVEKKTFIKYSYYYLIIFDDLSIDRTKSDEHQKKRFMQINIKSDELPAKIIEKGKFSLDTIQKNYQFRCENDAARWVDAINTRFKEIQSSK